MQRIVGESLKGKGQGPVIASRADSWDLPTMDLSIPIAATSEVAAAYFQGIVTLGLAILCVILHRRYGKPYFGWWALAWVVYATRLGAIITFLHTGAWGWLYWHQVTTGWTALALLWAALVFSRGVVWKSRYLLVALFPPAWSYGAIYRLDNFFLAAGPTVLFLSVATAWTGWALYRYHREVGSPAARGLAMVLFLWALHHLDYPFLRARGVWNPWGYYLDLLFELGIGAGILLLVLEDLDQGLRTLTSLSGELQRERRGSDGVVEAVVRRALALRGVHGAALYLMGGEAPGTVIHGAGVCALWPRQGLPPAARAAVEAMASTRVPEVLQGSGDADVSLHWPHPYTATLPILRGEELAGALVVVGEARDPFAALSTSFLVGFGQQVGAALANEELYDSLANRTDELEYLQSRMIRQHEEERERISRELHDETAQVLAAVNMQLGLLREQGDEGMVASLDHARSLVGQGIRSIRDVTRNLRPTVLDDLGLLPALRALVRDFGTLNPLDIEFEATGSFPPLSPDAELALYRSLQEALSNTLRHGACTTVEIALETDEGGVHLTVTDDGKGFDDGGEAALGRSRGGLAGMRERITAVGGWVGLGTGYGGGAQVHVWVPSRDRTVS